MSESSEQLSHEDLSIMAEGISQSEAERIHAELREGRDARDIVHELGGQDNVNRIIDPNNAQYLKGIASEEDRTMHENLEGAESEVWTKILEMKAEGKTPNEIIDHYHGFDELERHIGTAAARGLVHETKFDQPTGQIPKAEKPTTKGEN